MKNTSGAAAMGAEAKPTRRLNLSVQYASGEAALPDRAQFRRWARAALTGGGQVTLRLVGAVEGRQLNHDYRGKDYATNVLSFAYTLAPCVTGDLVLCVPVVFKEAHEQGKSVEAHFAHLVVHGMLHLQGFDHETDSEAETMEAREREILAHLGYPDPYNATFLTHET